MKATRRQFLWQLSAGGSGVTVSSGVFRQTSGRQLLDLGVLQKFVDPLPIPTVAKPVRSQSTPHYRIAMQQFEVRVHRDMRPTTFWGYAGACPGPTFDVRSGEAISVEWVNELPLKHLFAVDHTLHGAEADKPEVRTVVHLHGGRVGPESDGYPEHWLTVGQSAVHFYPNRQDAATLFYHDHAMGITRLNTAAGLMGMYIIRDAFEDSLNLPQGLFEIPLVIFDRSFTEDGQIYYPISNRPNAPWVSEYYGGGILVNGKLFSFLEVQPRKYRFRLLNSSNASFYLLSFGSDQSFMSPPLSFFQIGSDQGLHATPSRLNQLILGPGERADVVVDFHDQRGRRLYLRTRTANILEVRVSGVPVTDPSDLPSKLHPIERISESTAVKTRQLTLADYQDRLGRSHVMLLNGAHWSMPITEKPMFGSVEIWSFINLTDDSHPIHLHLVRFQVLDRRPFDLSTYRLTGTLVFTGPPQPLDPNEAGWKDTVRVDPLTVTRIIVRFDTFAGRYVWHCHILEHEDNEMMRPYEIVHSGAGTE